jgi:hypothetical protein
MKTYGGMKIYANKEEFWGGGGDNRNILFYRRTNVTQGNTASGTNTWRCYSAVILTLLMEVNINRNKQYQCGHVVSIQSWAYSRNSRRTECCIPKTQSTDILEERWRWCVPPTRGPTLSAIHSVISQKIERKPVELVQLEGLTDFSLRKTFSK